MGRITTSIDKEHLERYRDATGFWGFLDTIDDAEVTTPFRPLVPVPELRERLV